MSNNQKIDTSTITILYGHYDKSGRFIVEQEDENLKDYTINGNEITFNFHDVDKSINIVYQTIPNDKGSKSQLSNEATMTANGSPDQENNGTFTDSSNLYFNGNGTVNGDVDSSQSSSSSVQSQNSSSSVISSIKSSSSMNSSSDSLESFSSSISDHSSSKLNKSSSSKTDTNSLRSSVLNSNEISQSRLKSVSSVRSDRNSLRTSIDIKNSLINGSSKSSANGLMNKYNENESNQSLVKDDVIADQNKNDTSSSMNGNQERYNGKETGFGSLLPKTGECKAILLVSLGFMIIMIVSIIVIINHKKND